MTGRELPLVERWIVTMMKGLIGDTNTHLTKKQKRYRKNIGFIVV